MTKLVEKTEALRALAEWLVARGEVMRVGDFILDADYICVEDTANKCYRGDIAALIATQYAQAIDTKALNEHEYPRSFLEIFFMETYGIRGEFYESFVDVDEVLTDYDAMHDKMTVADYGTTLTQYLDRGVRGEVSWQWFINRLLSSVPS